LPEHAYFHDNKRITYTYATDDEGVGSHFSGAAGGRLYSRLERPMP
jgi:tryptophan synthase beta subunit